MGEQVDVWVVRMAVGEQAATTEVMVGETGGVLPPAALLLPQPITRDKAAAAKSKEAGVHTPHKE